MKISKSDFEEMKEKYDKEVKKGKPAKDSNNKDVAEQTSWVSHTKEDLMEVLKQDGVTGIKFHFTEYSQKVAKEFYGEEADKYIGRLGIVYSPIYDSPATANSVNLGEEEYYDKGTTCPPKCQ
jgi:hypothetical protein